MTALEWLASRLASGLVVTVSIATLVVALVAIRQLAQIRRRANVPPAGWTRVEMGVVQTLVDEGFTPAEAEAAVRATREKR